MAVVPSAPTDATSGTPHAALSAVELTNWSEQVLKKRLENVRGVGSVTLWWVARKREINLYLQPAAYGSAGRDGLSKWSAAVRNENQDLPVGAIRSLEQERMVQISSRMKRPEDFEPDHRGPQKRQHPIRLSQVAHGARRVRKSWKPWPFTTANAPCC